jgi:hypothetical protein
MPIGPFDNFCESINGAFAFRAAAASTLTLLRASRRRTPFNQAAPTPDLAATTGSPVCVAFLDAVATP